MSLFIRLVRLAVLCTAVSALPSSNLNRGSILTKRDCATPVDVDQDIKVPFWDYEKFRTAADEAVAAVEAGRAGTTPPVRTATCDRIRVRKEWRRLTREEQAAYMVAEKCLKTNSNLGLGPREDVSWYDLFTHIHQQNWVRFHGNTNFLPWHRWFVWTHGASLEALCDYTGPIPYWDFISDAENIFTAPVFSTDPEVGFGDGGSVPMNELGGQASGYLVDNGAFAGWRPALPIPHSLLRNFSHNEEVNPGGQYGVALGKTYNMDEFNRVIATTKFNDFETIIDGLTSPGGLSIHTGVHYANTGDGNGPNFLIGTEWYPAQSSAPNDPLFWIQHENVDFVWWQWQQKSLENQYAFEGPNNNTICDKLPFSGMGPDMPVAAALVTETYPLCYTYEPGSKTGDAASTTAVPRSKAK